MQLIGKLINENKIVTKDGKKYAFSYLDVLDQNLEIDDEVSFEFDGLKAVEIKIIKKAKVQETPKQIEPTPQASQKPKSSILGFSFDMLKPDYIKEKEKAEAEKKAQLDKIEAQKQEAQRIETEKQAAQMAKEKAKDAKNDLSRYSLDFEDNVAIPQNTKISNEEAEKKKQADRIRREQENELIKIKEAEAERLRKQQEEWLLKKQKEAEIIRKKEEAEKIKKLKEEWQKHEEIIKNEAKIDTTKMPNFSPNEPKSKNSTQNQKNSKLKSEIPTNFNDIEEVKPKTPAFTQSVASKRFDELLRKKQEENKKEPAKFSHYDEPILQKTEKKEPSKGFDFERLNKIPKNYKSQKVASNLTNSTFAKTAGFEFAPSTKGSLETQLYAKKIRRAGILSYLLPLLFGFAIGIIVTFAPQILTQSVKLISAIPYADLVLNSPIYKPLVLILITLLALYLLHISQFLKMSYLASVASLKPIIFKVAKFYAYWLILSIICVGIAIQNENFLSIFGVQIGLLINILVVSSIAFMILMLVFQFLVFWFLFRISGVWLFLVAVILQICILIFSVLSYPNLDQNISIYNLAISVLFIVSFAFFRRIK